jgi:Kdo2-lipid IVA lauroyltransferase/acyltransferase
VDWGGQERTFRELLAEGRGVLFATGHLGNWEMSGAVMRLRGFCQATLARPLDNALLDRYVNAVRSRSGLKVIAKFGAIRGVVRRLRAGQGVGMLMDQDGGRQGVFAPFFGVDASTLPTAADLAIRTGSPIVVAAMHRTDQPLRFVCRMEPTLRPDPKADAREERMRLVGEMNRQLENLIRAAPAQWLWMHRRWKTRPKIQDASNETRDMKGE